MTLTWVPKGQNRRADQRRRTGWKVVVGSLGFKILPEMVRVADSLYTDVKRHKEMGKDEGSRSGDGKTKPSERLRMRDPW